MRRCAKLADRRSAPISGRRHRRRYRRQRSRNLRAGPEPVNQNEPSRPVDRNSHHGGQLFVLW